MRLLPQASIRNKLVALTAIVLVLTVNLVLLLVYHQQRSVLREQMTESMHSQARLLAINSQAAVAFVDRREASRLLSSLVGSPLILEARTLVGHAVWAEYRKDDAPPLDFPTFTGSTHFTDDLLLLREDIPGGGSRPAGHIELAVSLQQYHDTMRQVMLESALVLGAALIVAIVLSRYALTHITQPIEQLNRLIDRVSGEGRFDERFAFKSRDEIGNLGQRFNEMLDTLETRDRELGRYRENLEHMVEARTQALRAAINEAREASRAKSDFLARMSHEIRTPMNAIIGFSRMVLETPLAPQQREHIEHVMRSSETLLGIINDILDFSKIEAGRLTLEHLPFELGAVFRSVSALLGNKAREKQLNLHFVTTPDTPPCLKGDALRLSQVLINLVANAVKFTERGEIEVSCRVEESDGQRVRLRFAVRDTGIGIPESQRANLFSPFSQADNSITRRYGGTGLGLVICRQLIELMGGDIALDSQPGIGTTFSFSAHFDVAEVGCTNAPESTGSAAGSRLPQWSGERILLVEDIAINRTIALALLKKVGLDADIAVNGQEALEKLATEDFRLVLMDIQMPIMDGLTACRAIRAEPRWADLPVIALSAHALVEDREQSRAAGMNEHLVKPIVPQTLYDCLARWLPPSGEPPAAADPEEPAAPKLPALSGIDTGLGLSLHMNRPALYLKTLHDFRDDFAGMAARIDDALADGAHDEARRLAHSTKSVAGSLGATGLQDCARRLEQALAERQPATHLEPLCRAFGSALQAVLDTLAALPALPVAKTAAPDPQAARARLQGLVHCLQTADARSEEAFTRLRECLDGPDAGPAVAHLLKQLAAAIDDVEYDIALEYLKQLEQLLEATA